MHSGIFENVACPYYFMTYSDGHQTMTNLDYCIFNSVHYEDYFINVQSRGVLSKNFSELLSFLKYDLNLLFMKVLN